MHKRRISLGFVIACAVMTLTSGAADAAEVWGGAYRHDIKDGLSEGDFEGGAQLAAGVISAPIGLLRLLGRPSAYATGAVNTDAGTNYATAGLSWRLQRAPTDRLYLRPGLGVGVHDAKVDFPSPYEPGLTDAQRQVRFKRGLEDIDLGARVLFNLELALGWQASERIAVEASWMHLSHGESAGSQNPGLSDLGVRLVYSLGGR